MSEMMPEPTLPWATITTTSTRFTITRVTAQPGKFGKREVLLQLDDKVQVSIWGANYLYLYNTFSADPDLWKGKRISIWKNDLGHRVVEA